MIVKKGDSYKKQVLITDDLVKKFAEVSGDYNSIHLDPVYASTTPFKKCIAHGLLSASFISSILANQLPGPGTIYISQQLNFKGPVFIDDVVDIILEVVSVREDKPIATIQTNCYVNTVIVIEGQAVVKFSV